jgi:hypothetical protein
MPKNLPGTHPMRRRTICIKEKDWASVRFIAYAYGQTPSCVVRAAVTEFIKQNYDIASSMALSLFEDRMTK